MTTRGLRLFNPGNIRLGGAKWAGLSDEQLDPDFCTFKSAEFGIRAMCRILLTYNARGVDTVRKIISTWAPASENDTAAYIADVAARCHVTPDEPLDIDEPSIMRELVKAIIQHEQGAQPYSDTVINNGLRLAGIADMEPPAVVASKSTQGATIAGVGTTVAAAAEGIRQLSDVQSTVDTGIGFVHWILAFGPTVAIVFVAAGVGLALYDYFSKRKRLGV